MKWLKKISSYKNKIPKREEIFQSRWLRPFQPYFDKPYYWNINRKNIAKAVAIGLFCGLMPGPTQMLSAAIFAYVFRTNLAVAMFTTLYTNPLTYIPLYFIAFKIGGWLRNDISYSISFEGMRSLDYSQLVIWFKQSWLNLLIGVPVLGASLAIIGYFLVLTIWKYIILYKRKA